MGTYLQPIQPWAAAIFEERERNPIQNIYKNPFVVLSSPALVVKGDTGDLTSKDDKTRKAAIDKLLQMDNPQQSYRGCIISNNINNLQLSYSTNETIVGVDFDGNYIKVPGEIGRKVSTPIITSVDVDTEEANNAIKTTRIGVKCFSLKQLEVFELFFCKPGMYILAEYGDSSLLKRNLFTNNRNLEYIENGLTQTLIPYSDVSEAIFIKKNSKYNDYCKEFRNIFLPAEGGLLKINQNIRQSLGSYDFTAGIIGGYTYSVAEDGTFDVGIEIFQQNQLSLFIPKAVATSTSRKGSKPKNTKISNNDQIKERILSDFNLNSPLDKSQLNGYEDEWFNFTKKNEDQKNNATSTIPYISLRFICKYLMNRHQTYSTDVAPDNYEFNLPKYKVGGKEVEFVPTHTSPYLISSNDDVVIPNKGLVDFSVYEDAQDSSQNQIVPVTGSKIDGSINKYVFNITDTYTHVSADALPGKLEPKDKIGNALNIFLKYESIVYIWYTTATKAEFIKEVLGIINRNMYGLSNLVLMPDSVGKKTTIVDISLTDDIQQKLSNPTTTYRFKPTTVKSIIKQLNYTFQMDNNILSSMMYNQKQTLIESNSKNKGKKSQNQKISKPPSSYRSYDYSNYANADGWYSINNVEKISVDNIELNKTSSNTSGSKGPEIKTTVTKPNNTDYKSVMQQKSTYFQTGQKENIRLIYKDFTLIQNYINVKDQQKSFQAPINISFTIDGFSGFRPGECFNIDGVPEIYNKIGVFMITNIKHNITPTDGWNTTIEAMLMVGGTKQ